MSLETSLFTVLSTTLGSSQVYPDAAPAGTLPPYITYQQIGGEATTFVDNLVPSKENALMQIEVWATTRLAAKAMSLAVESALTVATTLQARSVGAAQATFDEETDLRGSMQDFSIWANR